MAIDLIKLTAPEDRISSPIKLFLIFISIFIVILLTYGNLILKNVLAPLGLIDHNTSGCLHPNVKGKLLITSIATMLVIFMYLVIYKIL
jgi:hypothetical protein